MTARRPWAFIFMNKNGDVAEDRATVVQKDGGTLLVFGVRSVDEAVVLIAELIEEKHCSFVELCGAFDETAAEQIRVSCGHRIPIGSVTYPKADRLLFDQTVLGI